MLRVERPDRAAFRVVGAAGCRPTFAGLILVVEAQFTFRMMFPEIAPDRMVTTELAGLDRSLLLRVRPSCVVTPLVGAGFDVLDVAARLSAAQYRGTLYTLTPRLPRPRLIAAEVHGIAPLIEFEMIELPGQLGAA